MRFDPSQPDAFTLYAIHSDVRYQEYNKIIEYIKKHPNTEFDLYELAEDLGIKQLTPAEIENIKMEVWKL